MEWRQTKGDVLVREQRALCLPMRTLASQFKDHDSGRDLKGAEPVCSQQDPLSHRPHSTAHRVGRAGGQGSRAHNGEYPWRRRREDDLCELSKEAPRRGANCGGTRGRRGQWPTTTGGVTSAASPLTQEERHEEAAGDGQRDREDGRDELDAEEDAEREPDARRLPRSHARPPGRGRVVARKEVVDGREVGEARVGRHVRHGADEEGDGGEEAVAPEARRHDDLASDAHLRERVDEDGAEDAAERAEGCEGDDLGAHLARREGGRAEAGLLVL